MTSPERQQARTHFRQRQHIFCIIEVQLRVRVPTESVQQRKGPGWYIPTTQVRQPYCHARPKDGVTRKPRRRIPLGKPDVSRGRIVRQKRLVCQNDAENNAVNSSCFAKNNTAGTVRSVAQTEPTILYQCVANLIRFLLRIRGAFTAAPIIVDPVIKIPLHSKPRNKIDVRNYDC